MSETGPEAEPGAGAEVIRNHLAGLGTGPGVYRMLDGRGAALYVGKARNLRRRVAAYAKSHGHHSRIQRMIGATASMEFTSTATEAEALLLESILIKRLKPRFNILLRDDKAFPQILIRSGHGFPQLMKHRGVRQPEGRYFGPFASAGAVNRTLNQLQKAFLLRTCSDATFANRSRPCLLHQIRRCSGPCAGLVSEGEYARQVDDATRFLRGRSTEVQEALAKRMQEASDALDFERAALFRDRIRALTEVQARQGVNPHTVQEADLFALHLESGQGSAQAVFYRAQQHWGDRTYYPRFAADDGTADILGALIGQFYANRVPPPVILLSHAVERPDLLESALAVRRGSRVRLLVPQRGEKRRLVEQALENAREALARRMAEATVRDALRESLADAFQLEGPPQRIEVYDNSHIQGSSPVAAMIVAGPEGFQKSQYRKFNLDGGDTPPGDDTGMLRSVLRRRFGRLVREDPDRGGTWPDLVLIDGGAGHLSAACAMLADLGLEDVPLVAIAKGRDRDAGREVFHQAGRQPFGLRRRDPLLYYLQRLRDEAHRFAIGSHRARRKKATIRSPLDEIAGVGAARKRALLERFGSAKAVGGSGIPDLVSVPGISKALARRIHDAFRNEG